VGVPFDLALQRGEQGIGLVRRQPRWRVAQLGARQRNWFEDIVREHGHMLPICPHRRKPRKSQSNF
jgi:hypothetical protein